MQDNHNNCRPGMGLIRREMPTMARAPEFPDRWLGMGAMLLLLLMLAVALLLFSNTNRLLANLGMGNSGMSSDAEKIRRYNEKLELLQEKMSVFIADSVENRLRKLESTVSAGTVGADEIRTVQELKGELRLLEDYANGRSGDSIDPSRLEHARFQTTPGSSVTGPMSSELLGQATEIKNLLYLSIASCGFVGLMISGYWWQQHARVRRLALSPRTTRLLPRQSEATGE